MIFALRLEAEAIGLLQRAPLRPPEELVVSADRQFGGMARDIVDRMGAKRLRALAAHGKRIGVFEAEPAENLDAAIGGEPVRDLAQDRVASGIVAARHRIGPDRAGIIDIGEGYNSVRQV